MSQNPAVRETQFRLFMYLLVRIPRKIGWDRRDSQENWSSKLQNGHPEAQKIKQRQQEAFMDEQDAPDKTEIEEVSKVTQRENRHIVHVCRERVRELI